MFVLVRGVLPERFANRELVQRVARLETDLSRVKQEAVADLARAQDHLAQQTLATQAEISGARDQERLRAAREAARRDLGQALADEIAAEEVAIQERAGDLVVVVREKLLFSATDNTLKPRGKKLLRALAGSIHRLPAEQVYRVSARKEKRQRAVTRFLEVAGKVPHAQLSMEGLPDPAAAGNAAEPPTDAVEITLMYRKR